MTAEKRAAWLQRVVEQIFKVRLLFDENLPRSLKTHAKNFFPRSLHVSDVDLLSSDDGDIWEYARAFDLTIVTKDSDFAERVSREGAPPGVVQIAVGNSPVWVLTNLILQNQEQIEWYVRSGGDLLRLGAAQA